MNKPGTCINSIQAHIAVQGCIGDSNVENVDSQDGGCTCPGDVAKAFGAGADFVMLGGMLSGHDQSGGEIIQRDGKKFKLFYGMSSATAMNKHVGGVSEYRSA